MNIFEGLDTHLLLIGREENSVGCPFHKYYDGVINSVLARCENEQLCKERCGVLFPKGYQENYCPCHCMTPSYVKKRFWEKFMDL